VLPDLCLRESYSAHFASHCVNLHVIIYSYHQVTPSQNISAGICHLLSMLVLGALNYRHPPLHVDIVVPAQCRRVHPSSFSGPCFLKYGTWTPRGSSCGLRWGGSSRLWGPLYSSLLYLYLPRCNSVLIFPGRPLSFLLTPSSSALPLMSLSLAFQYSLNFIISISTPLVSFNSFFYVLDTSYPCLLSRSLARP